MDPFGAGIFIVQFAEPPNQPNVNRTGPDQTSSITRSRRRIKVYITPPGGAAGPTLRKENLSSYLEVSLVWATLEASRAQELSK